MSDEKKEYGAIAWGLQLVGFILAGVVLGQVLDHYTKNEKGIFTLICIVLSFIIFIAQLLRNLKK